MATINEVAAQLMEHLCTHNSHGYTQGNRWGNGSYETVTIDGKGYQIALGDRDCSSGIISAYRAACMGTTYEGKFDNATYTGNMKSVFVASGLFEWKPMSFTAQRGDIYLNEGNHTAMCTSPSPDMLAEFSISETGGIYGTEGDQTGNESHIRAYYDYPWDGILHYTGGNVQANGSGSSNSSTPANAPDLRYRVRVGGQWLDEMVNHTDSGGSSDDFAGELGQAIEYLAINMSGWYQVKTQQNGWLEAVRGYDINDLENGCAGDGSPILAVRCYYETPDPNSTGWLVIEYQAHTLGGEWLTPLHDLTDTGGSGDNFAGEDKPIDGFRARLITE